jgi:predicted  nucleic acid-binding Zn-ribbon protein
MESLTKNETCSNCNALFRIPIDKHIIASCPKCGQKFEYKNGEKVTKQKKRRWVPLLIFLVALGIFGAWLIGSNSKHSKAENYTTTINTDTTATFTPTPTYPHDNLPTPSYTSSRDTTEKLLDKLEDEITDQLLDILKDILEEIMDGIKEEAESGNWERANEWFERATDIMKKGGKNGKSLLKLYEGKLAKLKTDILSKDPNPNVLPGSELSGNPKNESSHATEYITNGTDYTLTLYYTGPTSTIVTIVPGGKKAVSLLKGSYSVVAKVSAPSVQEYYGSQTYRGFPYEVRYYITTSRY